MTSRLFCGFLICSIALGLNVSQGTAQEGSSRQITPPPMTATPALPHDGIDPLSVPRPTRPIVVKNITFKAEGETSEKVFVEFNQLFMPKIFGIEGDPPRIVLDVENAVFLPKKLSLIRTQGKWVRQIRTAQDPKTGTLRIVLDMSAQKNYFVNQVFYKAELMYVLDIMEERAGEIKPGSVTTEAPVIPPPPSQSSSNLPVFSPAGTGNVSSQQPEKTLVVANSNSRLYHLPGMKYYDKIPSHHRIIFTSEEDAQRAGYRKAPR
jgi:hypothetical protein